MPGIHTILYNPKKLGHSTSESTFSSAIHDENFYIKNIINDTDVCICATVYKEYPFNTYTFSNIIVTLEGIIYNKSESQLCKELENLANKFKNKYSIEREIIEFRKSSDGDFIIQLWDIDAKRGILFNDFYNRLSGYYYFDNGLYIFSKEIKIILEFIPKIKFSKKGMVQYLMREYAIGTDTVFTDINRLGLGHVLEFEIVNGTPFSRLIKLNDVSFALKNEFGDKKEAANTLSELILDSINNRVKKLQERGFNLIADLSGGFDSRTVLAGLSRFSSDISYFTFEYIQDESVVAQNVFQIANKPGKYEKLVFPNTTDEKEIDNLIYKTDGLVNYYTTSICYNDIQFLKNKVPKKTARFSGLGGEFIRHPFKEYYGSLIFGLRYGIYNVRLNIETACNLLREDVNELINSLHTYLDSYEKDKNDKLKHFYYEYYNQYVGIAGEERERIHMWTVQPLWGKFLLDAVYTQFPLAWAGFGFHLQVLRRINQQLSYIPFYRRPFNPKSLLQIKLYDIVYALKSSSLRILARNLTIKYFPIVATLHRKIKPNIPHELALKEFLVTIEELYNKLGPETKKIFDPNFFKDVGDAQKVVRQRLVTLMRYFQIIEKKFTHKLR